MTAEPIEPIERAPARHPTIALSGAAPGRSTDVVVIGAERAGGAAASELLTRIGRA